MDDFKKFTEQLLKIYINAESVNDLGIENYFDENISLIETISTPPAELGRLVDARGDKCSIKLKTSVVQ